MKRILVSACLLGINCRYDGGNAFRKTVLKLLRNNYVIFACPEQLGGLTTPRPRNVIRGNRVVNEEGKDVTQEFYQGAREFLKIARMFEVDELVLKARSPSCGKDGIVSKLLKAKIKTTYIR